MHCQWNTCAGVAENVKKVKRNIKKGWKQQTVTYMLPVAELLSVGREPLERSIWANLGKEKQH